MKCPIDQMEMEEMNLVTGYGGPPYLIDKKAPKFSISGMGKYIKKLIPYRCPKCGKVELTSEVKDEKAGE